MFVERKTFKSRLEFQTIQMFACSRFGLCRFCGHKLLANFKALLERALQNLAHSSRKILIRSALVRRDPDLSSPAIFWLFSALIRQFDLPVKSRPRVSFVMKISSAKQIVKWNSGNWFGGPTWWADLVSRMRFTRWLEHLGEPVRWSLKGMDFVWETGKVRSFWVEAGPLVTKI